MSITNCSVALVEDAVITYLIFTFMFKTSLGKTQMIVLACQSNCDASNCANEIPN